MAKYQQYAEYKDSGVEWLGKIPSHWTMSKLRYLFDFSKGLSITKENLQDEGIPCVNYGEVHSKYGFEVDPKKHLLKCVSENYLKTSENALLNNGDFVFADTSEDLKGSGNFTHLVGDEQIFAGYHTVIARPHNANASRFYAYLFESKEFRSQIHLAVKGVKVFSITQAMLRSANAWLPSTDEQVKIANFLDHETAKIDSLIEKQQQLIQLLKEKRQAVISHAVTKGLNPNVMMKDSGVEWLGQVPEHWEVSKIQYYAKIESGHTPSKSIEKYWENCTIPWISLNDSKQLRVVDYISDTAFEISELGLANSSARILPKNTVVFTRDASIGLSAITTKEMAVSQHLIAWLPKTEKLCPEFLLLIFYAMEKEFDRYTFGSTIKTIGMDNIRSLTATFPSLVEQKKIVDWCFNQFKTIDKSIAKSNALLTILRERRTALISAAVTGKIDVRNWQNPNNNNEAKMEFSA